MLATLHADKRPEKAPEAKILPLIETIAEGSNEPYDLIVQGRGGYKNPWNNIITRSFNMQQQVMQSTCEEDQRLQQGFKQWLRQFDSKASASLFDKADFVNTFVNKTTAPKGDMEQFGVIDYAPPVARTVSAPKIYADCEDYALMKYYALRHLGVEKQRLAILYVGTKLVNYKRTDHAVLSVDTSRTMNGRNAIILDNLTNGIVRTKYTDMAIFSLIREDKGQQLARHVKARPIGISSQNP